MSPSLRVPQCYYDASGPTGGLAFCREGRQLDLVIDYMGEVDGHAAELVNVVYGPVLLEREVEAIGSLGGVAGIFG